MTNEELGSMIVAGAKSLAGNKTVQVALHGFVVRQLDNENIDHIRLEMKWYSLDAKECHRILSLMHYLGHWPTEWPIMKKHFQRRALERHAQAAETLQKIVAQDG